MIRKLFSKYHPLHQNRSLKEQVRQLEQTNRALQDELKKSERIKWEYFSIIEQIEKQRDEWCEMFRTQSSEHLEAQCMLVSALEAARRMHMRLQNVCNALIRRYQPESDLIDIVPDPNSSPVDQAKAYEKSMQALEKTASVPIDGIAERAKIAARDHRDT